MNTNKKRARIIKAKLSNLNEEFDKFKKGINSSECFKDYLLNEVEEVKKSKVIEYKNEIDFNLKEIEKLKLIKSKLLRNIPLTQSEKEIVFKYI